MKSTSYKQSREECGIRQVSMQGDHMCRVDSQPGPTTWRSQRHCCLEIQVLYKDEMKKKRRRLSCGTRSIPKSNAVIHHGVRGMAVNLNGFSACQFNRSYVIVSDPSPQAKTALHEQNMWDMLKCCRPILRICLSSTR